MGMWWVIHVNSGQPYCFSAHIIFFSAQSSPEEVRLVLKIAYRIVPNLNGGSYECVAPIWKSDVEPGLNYYYQLNSHVIQDGAK